MRSLLSSLRRPRRPPNRNLTHKPTHSRLFSHQPPPPQASSSQRATKILSRLPPSLQKYTTRLRAAPLSHVLAFLILHELTAIIPLLSLFGIFHYTTFSPSSPFLEKYYGGYISEGAARF